MSAKIRVATLGCKVNQYETELVRQGLRRAGFNDCQEDESADLCIVNTCTVTNEGDSKSRQVVRRMHRDNPDAKIVVMGCYATRAPAEVAALPGVVEVVEDKRELPDLMSRFGVIDVPTGLDGFSGRHRAYVKVQDGCLLRCSYCVIPHVRPQLASRPQEHILDEVMRLAEVVDGHRNIDALDFGIAIGVGHADRTVKIRRRRNRRIGIRTDGLQRLGDVLRATHRVEAVGVFPASRIGSPGS